MGANNKRARGDSTIKESDITYHEQIGGGASSTVYRVTLKSKKYGKIEAAARKIPIPNGDRHIDEKFENDIKFLQSLSHPNIIAYYGHVITQDHVIIVTEYASNGTLHNYLENEDRLPPDLKLKWAIQVAKGIKYLQDKEISHLGIKSINLLIDSQVNLKLRDFGFAKNLSSTGPQTSKDFKGSIMYMPPEAYNFTSESVLSLKADIFAFGIVLWELETCEEPYKGLSSERIMWMVSNDDYRPEIPGSCPDALRILIQQCLDRDREERPEAEEIIASLMEFHKSETPAEILARGPAALEAYIKAAQDGTKSVYRTRLMLVGQERVGKTSLKKNITGQKFESTESITDGVDASTRCEVTGNSNEPWEIQATAKAELADHVQSQYMDTLCELMVQGLTVRSQEEKEPQIDGQIPATDSQQSIGIQKEVLDETQMRGSLQGQQVDTEPSSRQMDDTTELREKKKEGETHPATGEVVVEDNLWEEVLKRLTKRKLGNNEPEHLDSDNRVRELQIWDFAGQDVYYTTHQVFLSNRAIYIVTFDLCHDLTKPVKIQNPSAEMVQSRFHELTGLGFLDFWMQSIYAYATTYQHQPDGNRPQLSPPIFIVGTHRDSPDISKDPHDRKNLIEAKFQSISDMIAGKPYEKHVVSRYYAIENSSTDKDDHELSLLREHIVSVANEEPYMGEKIPLRWLTFEKSLAEAINEDQHYMDLKQVKDMVKDLGIMSDTELFTMLQFYHDLGIIIYFGGYDCTNSYLQDIVILDPQWLIDVFKRIITVLPDQKQWATLKDKWRRLKEEGILEDCLIDHMWHDLLHQKPALLALMEMFDLLCPRIPADGEGLDVQTYYVPACLQPCSEEDTQLQMAGERKQTTFYIDFHGFLPDGLFHRLMVHAARWSQHQSGEEPKLFHRYGDFCINDEHSFDLQMLTTKPLCIKVTISMTPVMSPGESVEDSCLVQPSHIVCDSVKIFLTQTLRELTSTWIHGIRYTFSVACPCNDLQQSPQPHVSKSFHLLPLEECLNKTKIKCKERRILIPTEVFKMWFQGVGTGDSLDTKGTTLSDVELLQLAEVIGIHWNILAIYLGLKKCHVDALNSDYPLTLDKAFNMLIQWRQGLTKMADARELLKKALKKCNLVNLVAKV